MDTRRLIDAIVQQTASLVAQLATAAGIRAPLARVADHVFLRMAQQLEAQGVGRKVAADMFGLTLRSYQKKLRRLLEARAGEDRSLWQAVATYLEARGEVPRQRLLYDFRRHDEPTVAAILHDLVQSGLAEAEGRGEDAVYRYVAEPRTEHESAVDVITTQVWLTLDREPGTEVDVAARLDADPEVVAEAVRRLRDEGLVEDEGDRLRATTLVVPVGSTQGWEAAVFDHYRAVSDAIGAKVATPPDDARRDRIGGATLSFDLHPEHPHHDEVLGLLERVRGEVNELWDRVSAYNQATPYEGPGRTKVWFYFGQNVEEIE